MALRVNTNIASINAQRNLSVSTSALNKSLEKISSGLRINRAADDPAGLAVSEKLRAQIRGYNQAVRNANDAVSLVQTAEGALSEVNNILVRMKELATQAANGTLSQTDRNNLDKEFQALASEITRISNVTEFNGTNLIDGSISASANAVKFQIGIDNSANDRLTLTMNDLDASALKLGANSGSNGITTISSIDMAQSALDVIDSAIDTITTNRGTLGALQNRLESTINNLMVSAENASAAQSRIRDVDFASETANYVKQQILVQAGTSILAQANVAPQAALSLLG
ncbi:MAG: flagellin FliC [Candidatus Schekmanbacteria bacterium]|nr:MAG: flagellin FliC [Candidatus Schekmanbacteria bacterium]